LFFYQPQLKKGNSEHKRYIHFFSRSFSLKHALLLYEPNILEAERKRGLFIHNHHYHSSSVDFESHLVYRVFEIPSKKICSVIITDVVVVFATVEEIDAFY